MNMARFEWAQVLAFDERVKPIVTVDDLLGTDPAKLKLALQPYLVLLQMDYPLDDYVIRLKQNGLRREASNASEESRKGNQPAQTASPCRAAKKVFVAVHRFENSLYYKRLEPDAYFAILSAIAAGKSVAARWACSVLCIRPTPTKSRIGL